MFDCEAKCWPAQIVQIKKARPQYHEPGTSVAMSEANFCNYSK